VHFLYHASDGVDAGNSGVYAVIVTINFNGTNHTGNANATCMQPTEKDIVRTFEYVRNNTLRIFNLVFAFILKVAQLKRLHEDINHMIILMIVFRFAAPTMCDALPIVFLQKV
jgi:hypothetical protein